jgi:hypothetical protein
LRFALSFSCRGEQQQHRGRVQQQCHDKNEPAQDHLIGLAEQGGKISDRPEIALDGAALALDGGLLDLQIGEDLRLDRELVGKAVTLGLPSFVVRGAELGDRRRAEGDGPN